jgi:hypothetical protein
MPNILAPLTNREVSEPATPALRAGINPKCRGYRYSMFGLGWSG